MSETSDRYSRFGFEAQRRAASAVEPSLKEGFALLERGGLPLPIKWIGLSDAAASCPLMVLRSPYLSATWSIMRSATRPTEAASISGCFVIATTLFFGSKTADPAFLKPSSFESSSRSTAAIGPWEKARGWGYRSSAAPGQQCVA